LLRLTVRRLIWKPTFCPTCRKRLDWGAPVKTAPPLLMFSHGLKHFPVEIANMKLISEGFRSGFFEDL
jgi:hypothetical protein